MSNTRGRDVEESPQETSKCLSRKYSQNIRSEILHIWRSWLISDVHLHKYEQNYVNVLYN